MKQKNKTMFNKYLSKLRSTYSTHSGFTLIELLVVIVIIGVLATLATVAVSSVRTKARDARRLSDIKQIQTALELYIADENTYPTLITPGQPMVGLTLGKTYMTKVPDNPTPRTEGSCPDVNYGYAGNDSNYILTYCLNQRTTQATTSVNVASNKTGNGTAAEHPVSMTVGCVNAYHCAQQPADVSLSSATNIDNQFGAVGIYDAWSSDGIIERNMLWDFGDSKNRTVSIKWKGSIAQWAGYCVDVAITLETSPDNSAWTIYKTVSYTHDSSAMSPITITPQLDVFGGTYRYVKLKVEAANSCLTSATWVYVDGIVSY